MGASGNDNENLQKLLDRTIKKFEIITDFFKNKDLINIDNKEFNNQSIIILLALREIDAVKNLLSEKERIIKIPQFNFKLKKIYKMKFNLVSNGEDIKQYNEKIEKIYKDLKKCANTKKIMENYNVSTIDNLITSLEKSNMPKIIKKSWESNFHQFFLDFIYTEIISKKMYTKEYLNKLYMMKYITQYLIFIKKWIWCSINTNLSLTKDEIKICKSDAFNEEKILSHFLLKEVENCGSKLIEGIPDLKNYNENALDELILFYLEILKIIKKFENNLNNNLL